MLDCMSYWYHNDVFRQEVTEKYLQDRSEYRRTGLTQKMKKDLESRGYEIKITS